MYHIASGLIEKIRFDLRPDLSPPREDKQQIVRMSTVSSRHKDNPL